ncbi:MAG: hypothetical protein HKM02_02260 [Pseudomonadales bacterium]|nr:hypothetical protein [Pseudomonadales bacterium]
MCYVLFGLMLRGGQVHACQEAGNSQPQDRDLLTWPLPDTHQLMQVYVGDVVLITLPHLESLYWLDQDVPVSVLRSLRDDALEATLTLMDLDGAHRNDLAYTVIAPGHAQIHFQAFVLPGQIRPVDVPSQLVLDLDAHVRSVVHVSTVPPKASPTIREASGFWSRWFSSTPKTSSSSQSQSADIPCRP